jgi:uncharacterized membrane protein
MNMENEKNSQEYMRQQAQQRADQIAIFEQELQTLEQEHIIAHSDTSIKHIREHHQHILESLKQRFDLDLNTQAKQLSWGMKIASLLGALAMAASLFFLFYQFWGSFSQLSQSLILTLTPLLLFSGCMWLRFKLRHEFFAKIAAMLTLVAFILNLAMLGQMFNITPSDNALLLWAALAFVLAYSCHAGILLVAGIILVDCFIAARIGTWSGMYWLSFGERPEHFILPSLILFFLPSVISQHNYPGFGRLYRVFAMLGFFIAVLILANWGSISYLGFSSSINENIYQTLGFVVAGLAIYWGLRQGLNEVVNTGNVFFILFLYTKFFDWWWQWMPKYVFFFILGLVSILALLVVRRIRAAQLSHNLQGERQ